MSRGFSRHAEKCRSCREDLTECRSCRTKRCPICDAKKHGKGVCVSSNPRRRTP